MVAVHKLASLLPSEDAVGELSTEQVQELAAHGVMCSTAVTAAVFNVTARWLHPGKGITRTTQTNALLDSGCVLLCPATRRKNSVFCCTHGIPVVV